MARAREFVAVPIVVALGVVAAFVFQLRAEESEAVSRVKLEDAALVQVKQVAAAQARFHASHGRYGWMEELRAAGELEGFAFRELDGDLTGASPTYRVDVLLPATTTAAGTTAIALRSEGRIHERAAKAHFAVVARPWAGQDDGWRSFYLDERGSIFVSEGVSDPATRSKPPLPQALMPENGGTTAEGIRWWVLDNLPPR